MANNVPVSKDVVGASDAASTSSTTSANTLLNQEINISNYMDYAQTLSYANSGLQTSIGLAPLTVNGKAVTTYDTTNGVQAEAFVTTSGPQYIVIGYGGTGIDGSSGTSSLYSSSSSTTGQPGDLFTGAQFYDDIGILAGQTPTGAAASATNFAEQVENDAKQNGMSSDPIYLTGHNLGGTLAEYAASNTGLGGTSFGAAGITGVGSAKVTNFTNIVANGDLIGNYATNGSNPLGPLVLSPNVKHYGTTELIGPASAQTGLRAEIESIEQNPSTAEFFLEAFATDNSLSGAYAKDLENKGVTVQNFGSYADPMAPQSNASASSQASAPAAPSGQASSAPTTTTASATAPSSQVIDQDINICNYLYSSRVEPFSGSHLKRLGLEPLRLTPATQGHLGKIVQIYNQKAGVSAEAFQNTKTGQIVIAYEGTHTYGAGETNKFSGGQLLDDAALFAGKQAACATVAQNFANRVIGVVDKQQPGFSDADISLTGHSLGAAEAEYAAETTGLGGVTFGTPGIVVTSNQPSKLTNFVDDGDPVGNYATDGADPLGDFVTSSDITHYGAETLLATKPEGSASGTPTSDTAETDLATTAKNFFTPSSSTSNSSSSSSTVSPYKNIVEAGKSLTADVYYHHLTTYAQSLRDDGYGKIRLVCYCTGTGIRTSAGDRPVETLRPDDLVVTASGETRPITWIGHRTVDCRKTPRPSETWPIRIAAHALGENRPARDLLVSPGHAICIDVDGEVLVPAGALVNGTTIVREEVAQVTYWHVELETHDILLAENLPAESYLEMGNRNFFANAGVVDLTAGPDARAVTHASFCRPYVDGGPLLDAIRARLDKKADALTKLGEARAA